MITIYDAGVIISGICAIIFTLKNDMKKALVSLLILFAIMYLKSIGI